MNESAFIEQTLETLGAAKKNARSDPKTSEIGALIALKGIHKRYGIRHKTVAAAENFLHRKAETIEEEEALHAMMVAMEHG